MSGLGYTLFGSEQETRQAQFLALWSAVAILYLTIGIVRVRRQRFSVAGAARPEPPLGRRIGFLLTVAASVTGIGAALDVIDAEAMNDYGAAVIGLGALVIVCAWLLLALGYARFYSHWTDWRFPSTPDPRLVDFLYFSVTVGVSFAASDVEVRSRALRWHVTVHSVVAFFYNAIVIAVAVGIITSR